MILHVRDISDIETEAQKQDVEKVLMEIGIDVSVADSNVIEVWNKIDLVEYNLDIESTSNKNIALISALSGQGIDTLLALIEARLSSAQEQITLALPQAEGKAISWLYTHATVLSRVDREEICVLTLSLEKAQLDNFYNKFNNISALQQQS